MLINYRAPALVERQSALPLVRGAPPDRGGGPDAQRARSRLVDPAVVQGQDRVHRAHRRSGLVDVFQTPFGRRARCPASSCTRAWPTASCRTGSCVRLPSRTGIAAVARRRVARRPDWPRCCPFTRRRPARARWQRLGWTWFALCRRSRAALWLNMVAAARRRWGSRSFRHRLRYFVEDREKRKVKGCSADTCRRTSTTQLLANPELGASSAARAAR